MAYLANIVENLSVICNPVWAVDSNREWMRDTQSLIIKHQRLKSLRRYAYSVVENELLAQPNSAKSGQQSFVSGNVPELKNHQSKENYTGNTLNNHLGVRFSPEGTIATPNVWGSNDSTSPIHNLSDVFEAAQDTRKYSLFDDATWLEFPKVDYLCGQDWASDCILRQNEPCRNDPAAWASWMRCRSSSSEPQQSSVDVASLLQMPVSSQELQGIIDMVLRCPGLAEQQLQKALAKPEIRQLWDSGGFSDAGCTSTDSKATALAAPPKTSETTYATVAGGSQERHSWPQTSCSTSSSRHRASASWAANSRSGIGSSHPSQVDSSSGRFSAPPAQTGHHQGSSASSRTLQEMSFMPLTTFSVTATYTSPALNSVLPSAPQRLDRPNSLMVAVPHGSLLVPSLNSLPRRSGDVRGDDCANSGQQQQPAGTAVWPERSSGWYSVFGWQYPTLPPCTSSSRYSVQQAVSNAGVPQYHSLKSGGPSPYLSPHEPLVPSQFAPLQTVNPSIYAQSKGLPSIPYRAHATTELAKYASQQSNRRLSVTAQQAARSLGSDSGAYKHLQMMFCQKGTSLPATSRGQFRDSTSDSSLRGGDQHKKPSTTAVSATSDRDSKPTESPRAPPQATFEDFLHVLGVSDGNNNDLFELWRIGQVSGSSGPPSTELSPRSDTLTPTAAASTPRDTTSSSAASGQLRRTKSLGSLPAVAGHQQSVSSSASRDSVTRRYDELEFLAIEQYESSDSLSRRFSDLERQALEQYALLSRQASREALRPQPAALAVVQQAAAAVPRPPHPPPTTTANANSRGAQPRSNTGGKPRKRRGKKKARELVVDTGIPQKGSWRTGSAANPTSSVSGVGSGWTAAGEDRSGRRGCPAAGKPCVVDGKRPGALATQNAPSYTSVVQHNLRQSTSGFHSPAYPNKASDFAATYASSVGVGGGARLPPPSFPASGSDQQRSTMSSMPAGLLNVGPLGSHGCREALAHAETMPASPLLWPQGFTGATSARSEASRNQQTKPAQEPTATDVEASCLLQ